MAAAGVAAGSCGDDAGGGIPLLLPREPRELLPPAAGGDGAGAESPRAAAEDGPAPGVSAPSPGTLVAGWCRVEATERLLAAPSTCVAQACRGSLVDDAAVIAEAIDQYLEAQRQDADGRAREGGEQGGGERGGGRRKATLRKVPASIETELEVAELRLELESKSPAVTHHHVAQGTIDASVEAALQDHVRSVSKKSAVAMRLEVLESCNYEVPLCPTVVSTPGTCTEASHSRAWSSREPDSRRSSRESYQVDGRDSDLIELPDPSAHAQLLRASSPDQPITDGFSVRTSVLGTVPEMRRIPPTGSGNSMVSTISSTSPSSPKWGQIPADTVPEVPESTPSQLALGMVAVAEEKDRNMENLSDRFAGADAMAMHMGNSNPHITSPVRSAAALPWATMRGTSPKPVPSFRGFSTNPPLRMHGVGPPQVGSGFLGRGPFWTCGTAPRCCKSRRDAPDSDDPTSAPCDLKEGRELCDAPDFAPPIRKMLGTCADLLAGIVHVSTAKEPPEDELTTVSLDTAEQRLEWRDFLSEAVSQSHTSALFASYDVDSEPPEYDRPTPSSPRLEGEPLNVTPQSSGVSGDHKRLVGGRLRARSRPHVVAPDGAGLVPVRASASGPEVRASASGPSEALQAELLPPGPGGMAQVRCTQSSPPHSSTTLLNDPEGQEL